MSRHELSDDILLMSTALKGETLGKPSESAPKSTTASEIFQAFATILTVTTPNDFSASNALAVTGIADSDSIKTLVVTRNKGMEPLDVLSKPTPAERAKDSTAMRNLANNYECVDCHPHDGTYPAHLLLVIQERTIQSLAFTCWIRSLSLKRYDIHTSRRLLTRIDSTWRAYGSSNSFTTVPLKKSINILWDVSLLATKTSITIEPVILHFDSASLSLTQALSSRSIIGNDRGEYVVTTGNIRDWILVLDDLHLELEAVITKGASTEEKRTSLKADSYDSFVDIIQVLYQLLECKPLVQAIEKTYCNADAFLVSHGKGLSSLYVVR